MSVDGLRETLEVLRRNKLRTSLTALSVAWGIFMLVLLLAAGNGLRHGVEYDFRDEATNSIWVRSAKTSVPFRGQGPGRPVNLDGGDIEALLREVPDIEYMTGRYYVRGPLPVSRGNASATFDVRGCHPDHQFLERTIILSGRFIDELDIRSRRKVAVIGPTVTKALFGNEDPLGQEINIRGVNYTVVGEYDDQGGEGELRRIYIPITTAQLVYNGQNRVHHIMFTTGAAGLDESAAMAKQSRDILGQRHAVSPSDRRALVVTNNLLQFRKLMDIFDWIRSFVWMVGLGTLFAGIVGVSNIMIISVQERTLEIGIRKAIGASPASIITMILSEAVLITSVAGYTGLTAGIGCVELFRRYLPQNEYIRDPSVDVRVGLIAIALLVLTGGLAGILPARKAARVRPVVAMRAA
jgi:putative ABC transport system permease protein